MRSELVFGAAKHISNRFLLTKLAAKATRKLHRPNTRIVDTTNDVFVRFSRGNPLADAQSTAKLQSFPSVPQVELVSSEEHLEQSVA
jgi:hypothetical protein